MLKLDYTETSHTPNKQTKYLEQVYLFWLQKSKQRLGFIESLLFILLDIKQQ